jgi:hypothetical protein
MSSQHTKVVVAAFVAALVASPAFAQGVRNDGISSDRPMPADGSRTQQQTTQTPGPATANPQQSMGQGAMTSSQPSGREALTQGGPTGTGRGTDPANNPGSFERAQAQGQTVQGQAGGASGTNTSGASAGQAITGQTGAANQTGPSDQGRAMTQGSGSTAPSAMGVTGAGSTAGRPDPAVGSSGQASTTNAGGAASGPADGNRMVPGGAAASNRTTEPARAGSNATNASEMGGRTAPGAIGTSPLNLGASAGEGRDVMAPPGAAGPAEANRPGTSTGTASNAAQDGVTPRQDPGVRATAGDTAANAPVPGANSFTEGQARARIEARGFTDVQNLEKDDNGIWRGQAMQGGNRVGVALDFQGNVVAQ